MGFFDNLFGRKETPPQQGLASGAVDASADEQAIARYRYMLKTAPPETIEQAHAEAFARLTPEQRGLLLEQLGAQMPRDERPVMAADDSPHSLARLATRAEVRQPGTIERMLGNVPGGRGFGGLMAGSLLSGMAGAVLGTVIAQSFLDHSGLGADAARANDAPSSADQTHTTQAIDDGGGSFEAAADWDT